MMEKRCLWNKVRVTLGHLAVSVDGRDGKVVCLACTQRLRPSRSDARFLCMKSAQSADKDPEPTAAPRSPAAEASGGTGGGGGGGIGSTLTYANVTYHDFERKLMARIKESNQRRFRVVLALVVGLVSWVISVFGERLRKLLTDHTAGLAKETLENESLKIQTQELAMAVVQTILNDQDTAAHAAAFLREAASNAETKQALVGLALHILQHPDTLKQLGQLSRRLLQELCADKVRCYRTWGYVDLP